MRTIESEHLQKGQAMNRQLGVVLLCAVLLTGCEKKEGSETNAAADKPTPQVAGNTEAHPAGAAEEAAAATLPTKLGDAAYPLTGLTWVKGDPVTIAPGKVYVVEFWATWCPPCRTSIPHLTALQKKYQDRVVFVGVSQEAPDVVKPFVSKQGANMDYTVAIDTAGAVGRGYMGAFGQNTIPHAFVVDAAGKVVWYGHPMGPIDQVLDQVLAGTYSISG